MRYPGENTAGRAPGRRQNPSGRNAPPPARPAAGGAGGTGTGRAAAGGKAAGDASVFAPGYTGGRAPRGDQAPAGGGWPGSPGDATSQGPAQGFPPAPGQPPPLYPPGPFAAWNRGPAPGENGYDPGLSGPLSGTWQAGYPDTPVSSQARHADVGYSDAGYTDTGYSDQGYAPAGYADSGYADGGSGDPGYSALAVTDRAADATNTPAWSVPEDATNTQAWSVPEDATNTQAWSVPEDAANTPAWSVPDEAVKAQAQAWSVPDAAVNTQAWELADDTAAGSGWSDLSVPARRGPDADELGPGDDPASGPPWAATSSQREVAGPQRETTGPQRETTGPFDLATPAPFNTGPTQRVAAGRGTDVTSPRPAPAPGRGGGTRGRGSRGRKRARGRGKLRAILVTAVALIIVVGATYVFLTRGHKSPSPAADSRPTASARPSTDPSPSPTLGTWGHIATRALDPAPLTLAELFPASFKNGTTSYVRTAQKGKVHCAGALSGSQLVGAVSHAGCTQAMRASYLSSDHKLMGTIGVLNLVSVTAAERAGKATGPSEFIAQLPGARGLTKNLTNGTGIEAAEVKGHYLVLVWAEFANLRTPRTPLQKSQLEEFITLLMQRTANVSLATRQVTGSPPPSA
jgi:hypothetical protein